MQFDGLTTTSNDSRIVAFIASYQLVAWVDDTFKLHIFVASWHEIWKTNDRRT